MRYGVGVCLLVVSYVLWWCITSSYGPPYGYGGTYFLIFSKIFASVAPLAIFCHLVIEAAKFTEREMKLRK